MSEPTAEVRITLRDVYTSVQGLRDDVQDMSEQVALLGQQQTTATASAEDHERRLRALEERTWSTPRLASVMSALATLLSIAGLAQSITHK
ncbi:hypothetical protein GCM10009760_26030 [Kitasatospora kazusensis]|uniref:Uncharacterized protein n=1 Tax=Kitasatospora kazusensis TaxID=407974 RepID=A0ABN2ZGG8_9ACTN